MELELGKKYFYVPLNKPCFISSMTTQAGGVSGENNMAVTIEFTDGNGAAGDCRTFSIGLADRYLSELRQPSKVSDIDTPPTFGEEDEQTVIL